MTRLAQTRDVDGLARLRLALWPGGPLEVRRTETEANLARTDGSLATFVAVDMGEVVYFRKRLGEPEA